MVYIALKFDVAGAGIEDIISIGTIGLIKAVKTFSPEKNIKLATYASRCIENEILMYIRKTSQIKGELSLDEPLNTDWDGNELLLSDVLGSDPDTVGINVEKDDECKMLKAVLEKRRAGTKDNVYAIRTGRTGGAYTKAGSRYARYFSVVHFPPGKKDHFIPQKRASEYMTSYKSVLHLSKIKARKKLPRPLLSGVFVSVL